MQYRLLVLNVLKEVKIMSHMFSQVTLIQLSKYLLLFVSQMTHCESYKYLFLGT